MTLRPGDIFDLAIQAGIAVPSSGDKRPIHCPFHRDRHKSAFLSINNVFACSVCCPEKGWPLKRFREALGAGWFNPNPLVASRPAAPSVTPFTAADAKATWNASFARARNDDFVEADAETYRYVGARGLAEAWEDGAFGVLPPDVSHPSIRWWRASGYSLIAALYDRSAHVVGVQSRAIRDVEPRTLFPAGSRISGSAFADRRAQRVLAGEPAPVVLLGEGLADSLAYAIASPWPTLSAPGTPLAVAMVGPWALGADVFVALDADKAGNAAATLVNLELRRHGARSVRRVHWPGGANDACDVVAERGVDGLHEYLRRLAPSEAA